MILFYNVNENSKMSMLNTLVLRVTGSIYFIFMKRITDVEPKHNRGTKL